MPKPPKVPERKQYSVRVITGYGGHPAPELYLDNNGPVVDAGYAEAIESILRERERQLRVATQALNLIQERTNPQYRGDALDNVVTEALREVGDWQPMGEKPQRLTGTFDPKQHEHKL